MVGTLCFLAGLFVGAAIGATTMGLMQAAWELDREELF